MPKRTRKPRNGDIANRILEEAAASRQIKDVEENARKLTDEVFKANKHRAGKPASMEEVKKAWEDTTFRMLLLKVVGPPPSPAAAMQMLTEAYGANYLLLGKLAVALEGEAPQEDPENRVPEA